MTTIKKIAYSLASQLKNYGTSKIFGVPGENPYTFPAFKKNNIEVIVCHHETHAAIAAGHSTLPWERPGVCYATIGPGATNLVTGIGTCLLDEIPLICLVETSLNESISNSHQVISQYKLFNAIIKAYFLISSVEDTEKVLFDAFKESIRPPFGPVIVGIPVREILPSLYWYNPKYKISKRKIPPQKTSILTLNENNPVLSKENQKIVFIMGPRTPYLNSIILNKLTKIPNAVILSTLMGKRAFSETYSGCSGYIDNEEIYFYTNKCISIEEFFNTGVTVLAININPSEWLLPESITSKESSTFFYLNEYANNYQNRELESKGWRILLGDPNLTLKQYLQENIVCDDASRKINTGKGQERVDSPFSLVNPFSKFLNDSGIITIDVGLIKREVCRIIKSSNQNQIFLSNGFSTLGSQLPAATGIALSKKDQKVICYMGDGGFLMAYSELTTIMHYNLPILIIISVNESYGQLRDKQIRYTSSCYGTDFPVPNLKLLANSFKFKYKMVETMQQLVYEITNFSNNPNPTIIMRKY